MAGVRDFALTCTQRCELSLPRENTAFRYGDIGPSRIEEAEVAWLQLVPFVEVGRVAKGWTPSELYSDMKWNVGLGLRAMVKGLVIRVDTAVLEEEVGLQMVGHPF